jgi:hypothetical protein
MKVEVERSPLRVWALSLMGVAFALFGLDVLSNGRFITAFGKLVYGAEQVPTFEPRDRVFALVAVIAGALLMLWGIRDLTVPRKLIAADAEELRLVLGGPFSRAVAIPWDNVEDVFSDLVDDDGQVLPAVFFTIADPSQLPSDPWGARWVGSQTLMVEAVGWSRPADAVTADLLALRAEGAGARPPADEVEPTTQ